MRQMYLVLFSISTTSNDGSLLTIPLRCAKASLVDTSYAQGGEYVSSFLMLAVQMQLFGLPAIGLGHPWIVCDGRVGIGASSGCNFVSGSAPNNEDNVGNTSVPLNTEFAVHCSINSTTQKTVQSRTQPHNKTLQQNLGMFLRHRQPNLETQRKHQNLQSSTTQHLEISAIHAVFQIGNT